MSRIVIAAAIVSVLALAGLGGMVWAHAAGGEPSPTPDVVVLTSANFATATANVPTLVKFFAPWCGHCKSMAGTYQTLAKEVNNVKPQVWQIAEVDCTKEPALQQAHGIRGFPTIKLFKLDGTVVDYRGARDAQAFKDFLTKEVGTEPPVPPTPPHLRYFETRGRGELIRLILEDAGKEYTDTRYTWDQWLAEKPNTDRFAFQQMPQLTIDGQDLVQSHAIIRYLGRKLGLYGDTTSTPPQINKEQTKIDVILGGFEDLRTKYNQLTYDKEFDTKKTAFIADVLPVWLGHFERLLTANGGEVFANTKFSIADVAAFDTLALQYELVGSSVFDKFPALDKFFKNFIARPKVNAYLKSERRPKYSHGASAFYGNEKNPSHALPL